MKNNLFNVTVGAIALALITPIATADPGDGKKPGGKRPGPGGPGKPGGGDHKRPDFKEILAKFDANGNGKLETNEKVEMIKARMAKSERFAEMVNKRFGGDDGVASDEEIAAFAEKMGPGRRPGGRGPDAPGKKPGGKKPDGVGEGFKPASE